MEKCREFADNYAIIAMFYGKIAAPVCALVRNDMGFGEVQRIIVNCQLSVYMVEARYSVMIRDSTCSGSRDRTSYCIMADTGSL